ncbi:MAG: 5-methylcytosine restriction system specificity protein McrC [Promethearchaeota archaeon]
MEDKDIKLRERIPSIIEITGEKDKEILLKLEGIEFKEKEANKIEIKIKEHVGTFRLRDKTVHVVPKIGFLNVFWILGIGTRWEFDFKPDLTTYGYDKDFFFKNLIEEFVLQSYNIIQKGLSKKYVYLEEVGYPKGKIMFVKTLTKYLPYCKFVCQTDYLSLKTLENQIIAKTISLISGFDVKKTNSRIWLKIKNVYNSIKPSKEINYQSIDKVIIHSLNSHYQDALKIARILLKYGSISQRSGDISFGSFWIYMPSVFHTFIAFLLEKNFQVQVEKSESIEEESKKFSIPNLRIDCLIYDKEGKLKCPLEVKYKDVDGKGVIEKDLHQTLAYGYYYNSNAFLVYPTEELSNYYVYNMKSKKLIIIKIHIGWKKYPDFLKSIEEDSIFLKNIIEEFT